MPLSWHCSVVSYVVKRTGSGPPRPVLFRYEGPQLSAVVSHSLMLTWYFLLLDVVSDGPVQTENNNPVLYYTEITIILGIIIKCPPYLELICDSDSTAFKMNGYIPFLSPFSMRSTLQDKILFPKKQILSSE